MGKYIRVPRRPSDVYTSWAHPRVGPARGESDRHIYIEISVPQLRANSRGVCEGGSCSEAPHYERLAGRSCSGAEYAAGSLRRCYPQRVTSDI